MNKITIIAERIILMEGWKTYGLAIGAGGLTTLALAPFHIMPVVFLTIPTLVWMLDGAIADPKKHKGFRFNPAFKIGWMFGFGYFAVGLWWIPNAILVRSPEIIWLMPIAVVAIPAVLACYWGVGAVIAKMLADESWKRIMALAVGFAIVEYARDNMLKEFGLGFAWNLFGYTFLPETITMQIVSVVGIHTITLFAFFIAATPAMIAKKDNNTKIMISIAGILIVGQIGFGIIQTNKHKEEYVPNIKIRIVQPNIEQKKKLNPNAAAEILQTYIKLSDKNTGPQTASAKSFTHIIWPESAFSFFLEQQPVALNIIDNLLAGNTQLITGAITSKENKVFNSILMLDSNARIIGRSHKIRLVPFGEFLPMRKIMEKLGMKNLTQINGDFEIGKRQIMHSQYTPPFLPLICYEIIFSNDYDISDPNIKPKWIVNLTNDAWFGKSTGPHQHAHQAIVRGVEMGMPVIRVANTGISLITHPNGKIIKKLNMNTQNVIDAKLPKNKNSTLFTKWGYSIFYIIISIAIIGLVSLKIRRK